MTGLPGLIIRTYSLLLRLYPSSFRNEFEEQMLLDFSDMAADAGKKGRFAFVFFCLRELVDFPFNLLSVHLREGNMFKVLRSQPVNYGLRGAIGFGAAFPTSVIGFVFMNLANESMLAPLQVLYYDLFHTLPLYEIVAWFPSALGFLLTGLLVGCLLAVLFADRSNYRRYILAGMLGWFLHRVTSDLLNSHQWRFFLGTTHSTYLNIAALILSGAFLGLILVVSRSERRESLRLLAVGAIAYPLTAYLYAKLLFKLSIVDTPRLFIALMILMAVTIASVLVLAGKSDGGRKNLWLVAVGAVGYPLLAYAGAFLAARIYSPAFLTPIYPGGVGFWPMVLAIALSQAVYGVLFGLLLGIAWGFQNKNSVPQVAAGT